MAKKKTKFICQSCGYESARWMGKCPGCAAWNTMTEEVEAIGLRAIQPSALRAERSAQIRRQGTAAMAR